MGDRAAAKDKTDTPATARAASARAALSAAEAQARLAAIVESSEDAIVSKDLDGTINSWNAAAERLFGYRAEEIIGQSVMRLIPAERSHEETEIIGRLVRGERVEHLRTWRRRKDGSEVEVELTISPVLDPKGRVIGASKIARDITERRRAEQAIADRDRVLRLAQQAARAGIWDVDLVSSTVHWSEECHAVYGTDPAAFTPSYEGWLERVHPDDRAAVLEAFQNAAARQGDFNAEFRVRHPERGDIWVWSVGQTQYGEGGKPLRSSGIVMDVDERRRAESLLRESEQRYRSLVSASGAIVFRSDAAARWQERQPGWEDYTGQSFEQYRDYGWAAALHPDDRARLTAEVQAAVETGTPAQFAARLWHAPSQCYRHVEARAVPLRDPQGQVREWVGSCADVHDRRVAQDQVAELAHNLRLVTDAIPALVSYMDSDLRYRFVNRAYETWFGLRSADLLGRTMREVLGDAAFQRIRAHVDAALYGQRVKFEQELPYQHGGTRFVRAEYMPDRRPDGKVAGFYALISDISEAKRTEAELRASEIRYRAVVENQSERVCRFRIDGTLLFVNEAYANARGVTPEALLQQNFWDFIPEEERDGIRAMLETMRPDAPEVRIENRFTDADGERWILWSNRALSFDEHGRVLEAQSSGVDITERKRAEQRLAEEARISESLNRLGSLLGAELDLDRLVQAVTDEATRLTEAQFGAFFYNVIDADGKRYQLYALSGADRAAFSRFPLPRATAIFEPTFSNRGILRLDDVRKDPRYGRNAPHAGLPEGHLPVTSYLAVPVVAGSGEVLGGLFFGHPQPARFSERHERLAVGAAAQAGVAIDNARLYQQARRQTDELRESDRRKDEFLAVLSHELRNPLAPIRTGIDILRHGGLSGGAAEGVLEAMERQANHLTRLVDDLLEVSRVTRGQITLKREPMALGSAVQEAVAINQALLDAHAHRVVIEQPPRPLLVDGDRTRLTQVIANLLNNAAKYTPDGGQIRIALEQDGRDALLVVSDNGIGIPPGMLGRIFDIFTQVDRSTERSTGGLGIGLSLVKRLVELHGGSVEARSAGEDQGSEFRVRLPLCAEVPSSSAAAPLAERIPPRRVLVIDDNHDAANTVALLLRALGHDAHQAHDGEAGLALAESLRPEVMLLDIGMPRMSGYEVARRLRSQPWARNIQLVALTGWGQEEDRARSVEAGFDRHLVKPVQLEALQEILAAAATPGN